MRFANDMQVFIHDYVVCIRVVIFCQNVTNMIWWSYWKMLELHRFQLTFANGCLWYAYFNYVYNLFISSQDYYMRAYRDLAHDRVYEKKFGAFKR